MIEPSDERTYFYLRRHPITDEIAVREQVFRWNGMEWVLPDEQPSLPNMVEGTDFYETRGEAIRVLNGEVGDGSEAR